MELLLVLAASLCAAAGVMVAVVALTGAEPHASRPQLNRSGLIYRYPAAKQILYPTLAVLLSFAFTRWVALSAAAGLTAALIPRAAAKAREQHEHFRMTEALAAWVEQLRDAFVANAGIEGPLRTTAATGPEYLRPALIRLSADLETNDTTTALRNFATEVEHHIADTLVTAYALAAQDSTAGLEQLLNAISSTARREVETWRAVDTSRRKLRSSNRIITGMLGLFGVSMLLFARNFLHAYDTVQGQLVLLLVCAMVLGSYQWMNSLSIMRRPPRFFAMGHQAMEDLQRPAEQAASRPVVPETVQDRFSPLGAPIAPPRPAAPTGWGMPEPARPTPQTAEPPDDGFAEYDLDFEPEVAPWES